MARTDTALRAIRDQADRALRFPEYGPEACEKIMDCVLMYSFARGWQEAMLQENPPETPDGASEA